MKNRFIKVFILFISLFLININVNAEEDANLEEETTLDNEINLIYDKENICSSAISCILYFFNFGISSEGSINMNLISFKNNTSDNFNTYYSCTSCRMWICFLYYKKIPRL